MQIHKMDGLLFFNLLSFFPIFALSEQRIYYISAEEVSWNYAPSGKNLVTDNQTIASKYLQQPIYQKILYKEYTDINFNQTKYKPDHHGFTGPVLKVEVGDDLVVYFKNNASMVLTIHPHGVTYNKANEGSVYEGQPGVDPGTVRRYTWNVTEESGPLMGTGCVSHLYHSSAQYVKDVQAGLFGFIQVCASGDSVDKSPFNKDLFLFVGINNENENPVSNTSGTDEESNIMHSINGYVYGNLPNLTLCVGVTTRLHIGSLSDSTDVHGLRLYGHTFAHRGKRFETVSIYPGVSTTVEVTPAELGKWLLSSTSKNHIKAGMQALVTVKDCGEARPIIEADGEIREYYIAAGEVNWQGKTRVMLTGYTDRTFREQVTRDTSSLYHGALGSLIMAEVGDVLKIVFFNKLNQSLTIVPTGLRTSKQYEGKHYNDDVSDKVVTGPGEKRTYYWFVPEYMGPNTGDADCIHKVYYMDYQEEQTLLGPILVCRRNKLLERTNELTGKKDVFLYIMENSKAEIDLNGYVGGLNFPRIPTCTGTDYRVHLMSATTKPQTLLSRGDPFLVDGSVTSTIGLIPNVPVSVTIVTSTEGNLEIMNFPQGTVKAFFTTVDCGGSTHEESFSNSTEVNYLSITKAPWFYNKNTSQWKGQQTGKTDDIMEPRYYKAFMLAFYSGFRRPLTRIPSQGNVGHTFFATIGDTISIAHKLGRRTTMNYSIFAPGLLTELNPGKPNNFEWKVPRRVGPGPADPECVSKIYFSSVNMERDIASGLIGPIIVCNKTVDSKQHTILFLGEVDETKNWFFNDTVKKFNKREPPSEMSEDFINNNKINMVNGFSDGTIKGITLGAGTHFIHLFNVGSKFESLHLSGIPVTKTNSLYINNDIVGLHPGTSVTVKVAQEISGNWRLDSLGTTRHWNNLQAFIDVPVTSGAS